MRKNFITIYCLVSLFMLISASLYSQAIDANFNANLDMFGLIGGTVINVQSDGKVLIQTNFAANANGTRNNLARLNANGSLDLSFNSNGNVNDGEIRFARQLSDGKILLSGTFPRFNGSAYKPKGMIRLNSDGSVDNTFQAALQNMSIDNGGAFAVNSDGSIIVSWRAANYGSYHISKLSSDGSLDNSFQCNLSVNQYVNGIEIQPDGKFIVFGESDYYYNDFQSLFKRFNADGSDDAAFNAVVQIKNFGYSLISKITILPSTDILVSGSFNNCNGAACKGMAELSASGSLVSGFDLTLSFMDPVNTVIDDHLVLSDGKILTSGGGFVTKSSIVLLNTDGTLNSPLTNLTGNVTQVNGGAIHLSQDSNNNIYIMGHNQILGVPCPGLARIDQNFNHDFTFAIDPYNYEGSSVTAVKVQSDLKVVVGGVFNFADKISRNNIARLNFNGSIDQTFNPGTGIDGTINDIAIQPDGKIVVAGAYDHVNQEVHHNIVRLNADGSIDQSFVADGSLLASTCKALALQTDGKILVENKSRITGFGEIIRLNSDGSKDGTFTSINAYSDVSPIGIQNDGKILISGFRFNADGTRDYSFNPPNGASFGVIEGSGDLIMLNFSADVNTYAYGLLRVGPDGSLKNYLFNGYPANNITAIYQQSNKKALISTSYSCCTPDVIPYTFRMNTDGSIDNTFVDSGLVPRGRVAIVGQGVDLVLMAGPSGYVNYTLRKPIVRLKTPTLSPQTISFSSIPDKTYNDSPISFNPVTSSSSGLPVSLSVVAGPATLNGNVVTINGTGMISIKASQSGDQEYYAASDVTVTFYSKKQQTITFPSIADQIFQANPTFVSLAASSSSGLNITYQVISGQATVSGSTLSVSAPGKIVVQATQIGDNNYFSSQTTQTFYVKSNQSISFSLPDELDIDNLPGFVQLQATATSGLPVLFEINSGSATISNTTLNVTGYGLISIKASQAGNDLFFAGNSITAEFYAKKNQVITFNAIGNLTYSGSIIQTDLIASASSGLSIVYSILEGNVTLSGNELTILGAGKIRIQASQPGNTSYAAATPVERIFYAKQNQTIDFSAVNASTYSSNMQINLIATSSSGLPVTFSLVSGSASVDNSIISPTSAGPIQVTATQEGNDFFFSANAVNQTFCVNPIVPTIQAQGNVLTSSSQTNNQWFRDGLIIPGEISQSLTITEGGGYYVQVNVDGCFANSVETTITGIWESADLGFTVHPNPAKNEIFLNLSVLKSGTGNLKLYNSKGEEILSEEVESLNDDLSRYQMDIRTLPKGIYLVVLRTQSKSLTQKVVLD